MHAHRDSIVGWAAGTGRGVSRKDEEESVGAMMHREGDRQPGVAYVAIVLFAVLVATMLVPGYTLSF